MTTTTHAKGGAGRPRLIIAANNPAIGLAPDSPDRVHELRPDVTTIGSDPGCDVVLPYLEPVHVHVVRDEWDEFRVIDDSHGRAAVDGLLARGQSIHTGDRLMVGPWVLLYERDEFADHGRPYGGRQGGEFTRQRSQPPRTPDPTARAAPDRPAPASP